MPVTPRVLSRWQPRPGLQGLRVKLDDLFQATEKSPGTLGTDLAWQLLRAGRSAPMATCLPNDSYAKRP